MAGLSPVQSQFARLADTLASLNQPPPIEKMGTMPFLTDIFGQGVSGGNALSFMDTGTPSKIGFAGMFGDKNDPFGIDPSTPMKLGYTSGFGAANQGTASPSQVASNLTNAGGDWAALDRFNTNIGQAASQWGVPANLLKSIINNESSGNWERDGSRVVGLRGERMLPFLGIFESTARAWGVNFDSLIGNLQGQVDLGAKILAGLANQYGGYDNAAKVYFGGEQALHGSFVDEFGNESNHYAKKAIDNWHALDAMGGGSMQPTNGMWGGNQTGNSIVNIATQFVGKVPYVWGGIPGKGQTPTGWDCSGFTYWLDQNYGNGQLPEGSHYQYQYAQQTGRLFTNMNQLSPGDLVFIDTGWQGGAGSNLNRAGHVAMYIGNGQIVHAANENVGTIISPLSAYGNVLGGMHMSWSGGAAGVPTSGASSGSQFANPGSMFAHFLQGGSWAA